MVGDACQHLPQIRFRVQPVEFSGLDQAVNSGGALSAGGTTVQISIHPGGVNVGSTTATLSVQRVNGTAGRITTHGTTTTTVPISVSLVTPVTPAPRDTKRCERLRGEERDKCMQDARKITAADERTRGPGSVGGSK